MGATETISYLDLLIGVLILCALALKGWFRRIGVPALVAYLLLGLALRWLDDGAGVLSHTGHSLFEGLARLGIIVILFRVGLESNLHRLVDKLGSAIPIWIGNVVLSGLAGYVAARYVLQAAAIPSLFVALAMTATSVAVSVDLWREAGRIDSPDGALLVDVAGLDDVSGVALLGLLVVLVPAIREGDGGSLGAALAATAGVFLFKAGLLGGACLIFARYFERRITHMVTALARPDAALAVLGTGIVIAALAAGLGFSLAIGALFAGLVFSRDPDAVRLETVFEPLYGFFAPFFFIGIGLHADIAGVASWAGLGAVGVLFVAAVAGKFIGTWGPALLATDRVGAAALGASMTPRAEIAMVIMQEGRALGPWAVPPDLFAAMVGVTLATSIAAPPVLRLLLRMADRGGAPGEGTG